MVNIPRRRSKRLLLVRKNSRNPHVSRQFDSFSPLSPKRFGKRRRSHPVYCICKKAYRGQFMIQCETCLDWFHGTCIQITYEQAKSIQDYTCASCSSKSHPHSLVLVPSSSSSTSQTKGSDDLEELLKGRGGEMGGSLNLDLDSFTLILTHIYDLSDFSTMTWVCQRWRNFVRTYLSISRQVTINLSLLNQDLCELYYRKSKPLANLVICQVHDNDTKALVHWKWLSHRFTESTARSSFVKCLILHDVSYPVTVDALHIFENLEEFQARIRCWSKDSVAHKDTSETTSHDLYHHFASYEKCRQIELLKISIRSASSLRKLCLDFTETCHASIPLNYTPSDGLISLSECHRLEELRLIRILFVWSSSLAFLDRIPHLRCLELCIENSFPVAMLTDKLMTFRETLEVCRIHSDTFSTRILPGLVSCRHLREVLVSLGECLDTQFLDSSMYLWNELESLILVDVSLASLVLQDRDTLYRQLHQWIVSMASLLAHPPELTFQSEEPHLLALLQTWRDIHYPKIVVESEDQTKSIFSRIYPF